MTSMPQPLLQVDHLSIAFNHTPAVESISFHIHEGETLGLVGESGSGKSATSLAILRLLPPTATTTGNIAFAGTPLLPLPEESMRRHRGCDIAMIFQEPMTALNPVMPIGQQIAEAIVTHKTGAHSPTLTRKQIRNRVLESLHEVALPDPERRLRDYPHQFSGGQRQRILIAMAIVHRPRRHRAGPDPRAPQPPPPHAQPVHALHLARPRRSLPGSRPRRCHASRPHRRAIPHPRPLPQPPTPLHPPPASLSPHHANRPHPTASNVRMSAPKSGAPRLDFETWVRCRNNH